MTARGFILQASYRVQGGAPVVQLYGKLESGETFLVRDHRQRPSFYVRTLHAERARQVGAERIFETSQRTFDGAPVSRVEVPIPQDAPVLRDR
jgi:hypothetical protein